MVKDGVFWARSWIFRLEVSRPKGEGLGMEFLEIFQQQNSKGNEGRADLDGCG